MKHLLAVSSMIAACFGLVGCMNLSVPRYSVNSETVLEMRKLRPHQVSVGHFSSPMIPTGAAARPASPNIRAPGPEEALQTDSEILCRGSAPVKTPDGESYGEYVRRALISELTIADVYNPASTIKLSGSLSAIDFNTVSGEWALSLNVTSTNGHSVSQSARHTFATSFDGITACTQAAQAGMGAVQELLFKVATDPGFARLFEAR